LTDREVLASKLKLLTDLEEQRSGGALLFPKIEKAMAERGVRLTRVRWYRLRAGSADNKWDPQLLKALADFFGVPASYLLERESQLPPDLQAKVELMLAMKAAEVQGIAARIVGEVSPEALNELARLLDKHRKPGS
jgi:hypothetical protein